MTSYLRSWWFGGATTSTTTTDEPDVSLDLNSALSRATTSDDQDAIDDGDTTSQPHPPSGIEDSTHIAHVSASIVAPDEDEDSENATPSQPRFPTPTISTAEDDDAPPLFPAPNSIQRQRATNAPTISTPDDTPPVFPAFNSIQRSSTARVSDGELMPPPPLPVSTKGLIPPVPRNTRISPVRGANTLVPAPSANINILSVASNGNSLSAPSSKSNTNGNTLTLPSSTTRPPPKPRKKVALAPGHSPLDWAALKTSGEDLRGVTALTRITPSELKEHNTRADAWTAIAGKVYNITPYLPFHPGGERELMRVAGRDGTKLFALTHSWVNADVMLDECLVGFLAPEP